MDYLAVGQLVGGLVPAITGAIDPYFYTDQEKARDGLAAGQLTTQQAAISAQAQATASREQTNQMAITYATAGVMGVGLLYLASRFVK